MRVNVLDIAAHLFILRSFLNSNALPIDRILLPRIYQKTDEIQPGIETLPNDNRTLVIFDIRLIQAEIMKVSFTGILILFFGLSNYAQEVLGPAGQTDTISGHSVSWTLGESAIITSETGSITVTEGFEQPHFTITSLEKRASIKAEVSIYPNPTAQDVTVKIKGLENEQYTIQLLDQLGKEVLRKETSNSQTSIPVSHLSAASYFIIISNAENSFYEKFNLIKSH